MHANWEILFYLSTYRDFCNPSSVSPRAESTLWTFLVLPPYRRFKHDPDWRNTSLTELFPMVEWEWYVESQRFTTLHQIVCGLSGLSLDAELQGSTHIDRLDINGRSALWYAVRHQRLHYVRTLLEQGADPNFGDSPLWVAAAQYKNIAITEMLLNNGSSLSPTLSPPGRNGWLPWPDEIFWHGSTSVAVDELLIRHVIDLNHRAEWCGVEGVTIFMRLAAYTPYCPTLSRLIQLIEVGADMEITDKEGMTAIMYAAQTSHFEAFDILARAGARFDLKTVTGSTILHLAIAYTVDHYTRPRIYRLCKVMRDADLTKIDVDAKNEDGHRAYDLLRIRNGPNWDGYCESKGIHMGWSGREYRRELEAISTLEDLLHHVQESQGVPEADRYPPLGEFLSRDGEEEVVPGAWPAY